MDSSTLIWGISLGVYLCVTLVVGTELIWDFLRVRKSPVTTTMRLAGMAMMCDTVAIVGTVVGDIYHITGVGYSFFQIAIDAFTSSFLLLSGFSLVNGGKPTTTNVLYVVGMDVVSLSAAWISKSYIWFVVPFDLISVMLIFNMGQKLLSHDKKLSLKYSDLSNRETGWFLYYIIWTFLVTPVYHVVVYFSPTTNVHHSIPVILFAGMYVFLGRNLIVQNVVAPIVQPDQGSSDNPSASTPLSDDQIEQMASQLSRLMHEEKVFVNSDLCVDELAQMMNTNTTYLYYFLRDTMHTTFFEMVNACRVDEAKLLLKDKTLLIEEIATNCGFNSANSFRRVFKRATDLTPSEYRDQLS